MRILSICDIQLCGTALYLAGEERKIHPVGRDEKGVFKDAANERIELLELLVSKRGPPESNRVVRFR